MRCRLGVGRLLDRRLPPGDPPPNSKLDRMSMCVGGGEYNVVNRVGGLRVDDRKDDAE